MRADLHEIAVLLVFLVVAVNGCTYAVMGNHGLAQNMAMFVAVGVAIVAIVALIGGA